MGLKKALTVTPAPEVVKKSIISMPFIWVMFHLMDPKKSKQGSRTISDLNEYVAIPKVRNSKRFPVKNEKLPKFLLGNQNEQFPLRAHANKKSR